jgi:hypothetical protein
LSLAAPVMVVTTEAGHSPTSGPAGTRRGAVCATYEERRSSRGGSVIRPAAPSSGGLPLALALAAEAPSPGSDCERPSDRGGEVSERGCMHGGSLARARGEEREAGESCERAGVVCVCVRAV